MIMQRSAVVTAGIILFTNVGGNVGVFAFQPGMPTGNVNTNQPRTSTCTVVHASLDDNNSNNSPKRNKIRLGSLKRAARKKIAVGAAFALTLLQAGSPASAAAARSARPIKNQPPPVETNAHEAKQRLPIVGASVIVATGVSFKRYFFRNNMYDEDDEPSLDQEIRRKRFDEIMGIQAPPVRERDVLEDDEIIDQSMVNEEAETNEKKSMVEEWFKRAVADAEPKLNEDDTFVGYEDENDYDDEIKSDVIVSEDVQSFGDSAEEVGEKTTIAYEEIILVKEPLGGVEEETTGFLSSISNVDFIPKLTSPDQSMVNEEAELNEKKSMVEEWFKRAVADAEPKLNEDDTFVDYADENDYDDEIKSDVIVSEDVYSFGDDSAEEVDENDTIAYEEIILAEGPLGGVEEETAGFLSSISKIDFISKPTSPAKRRKTLALKNDRTEVEDAELSAFYGAMIDDERAFAILADLNLVSIHVDPDDPYYDTSRDDDFCDDYFVDLPEVQKLGDNNHEKMGKITKFNFSALKRSQAMIAS